MSISTLEQALVRIEGAFPESPIAVFKCKLEDKVSTVFASTVKTKEILEKGSPALIGVFDNTMENARETIKQFIK